MGVAWGRWRRLWESRCESGSLGIHSEGARWDAELDCKQSRMSSPLEGVLVGVSFFPQVER